MPASPKERPSAPTVRLDAVTIALIVILILANLVLAGGGEARLASVQRDRLQLAAEPVGAQDVLAARGSAKANPGQEIVLVGRIGGMPNPWPDTHKSYPWYPGQASLFLVDLDTSDEFMPHMKKHGWDTAYCAFCRRKAEKKATSIAVVNFVDDAGNILPVDARELLNVRDGQTIVVHGTAELLGGTMLVVNADGVYVRK
jgi:hypothetical protein